MSTDDLTATFKPTATGPLANGWYESYVNSQLLDISPTDNEKQFSFLNADFNGDHVVNFNDFLVQQNNFDQSGKTFADGDADYNGTVDFNDFMVLQNNFGQSLPNLPTTPGGVVVGNVTAGNLDVGWAANNTDPRDGFKIYRSDDNGQTYTLIKTLVDPALRAWRDTGTNNDTANPAALTLGQKYWYRVRAYTTAGGASASITKAAGVATQPTPAPTHVSAAGIGPGRIQLVWTPPTGAVISGYRIYRSASPHVIPSPATLVTEVDGTKSRITDSGLSRGHTYYYVVVSVGVGGSISLPSAQTAAVAQNQGAGISNYGTPFDPLTHDSDGDGIPDAQDTDNDNDGSDDEQDSDDDNNGTPDNAEPDDRDTDGDGTPDDQDSDDDNDSIPDDQDGDDNNNGIPDDEDASTGDTDKVPTGPGPFTIFSTRDIYSKNGLTPDYVHFKYDTPNHVYDAYSDPEDQQGEDDTSAIDPGPMMRFVGSDANNAQTFTMSNLPKHAVVGISGTIEGGGWATSDGNGSGKVEVTAPGGSIDHGLPGPGTLYGVSYFRIAKAAEFDSDTVTFTLKGSGFSTAEGDASFWYIQYLSIAIAQYSISAPSTATLNPGQSKTTTATVQLKGDVVKDKTINVVSGAPGILSVSKSQNSDGTWSITLLDEDRNYDTEIVDVTISLAGQPDVKSVIHVTVNGRH